MEKIILIKYGELTTKKANRNLFISKIYEHMKELLSNYDVKIIKNRVRMFIEVNDNNLDEVVNIVKNIFGIHRIVIAYKVKTDIEEIETSVLELTKDLEKAKSSFRVSISYLTTKEELDYFLDKFKIIVKNLKGLGDK